MKAGRAMPVDCPWCESRHMPRFMCDPAAKVLEGLDSRARRNAELNTMPTVDFDEPLFPNAEPGDVLMTQLVVMAAAIPFGGVNKPAVIFTGRDQHGNPLPRWLYVGTGQDLKRAKDLVTARVDRAVEFAKSNPVVG